MTCCVAFQISGPVPSPSMYGTIGSSGTTRRVYSNPMRVPEVGWAGRSVMAPGTLDESRRLAKPRLRHSPAPRLLHADQRAKRSHVAPVRLRLDRLGRL